MYSLTSEWLWISMQLLAYTWTLMNWTCLFVRQHYKVNQPFESVTKPIEGTCSILVEKDIFHDFAECLSFTTE